MAFTYGWHWDTASINFERAIPILKASKADTHLIMIDPGGPFLRQGDLDTIRKIHQALPKTTLIIRVYSRLEGNWSSYPTASQYYTHWAWVRAQLGREIMEWLIFDDPCNEPNLAGPNVAEAKRYVQRCRDLVLAAHRAGVKLAIGAWSVGTPDETLFESVYLSLMRDVAEYKMAYSYHAYVAIPPRAGETDDFSIILNLEQAKASFRDEKVPLNHAGWRSLRMFWIIRLHEKYGLPTPEICLTEVLIDNIFNSDSSVVKEAWKQAFSERAYPDPRGARAWMRYMGLLFEDEAWDFSRTLAYIFRYVKKNFFWHPAFRRATIFALNAQWDYAYAGHSVDGQHKEAGSNFDRPEYDAFRNLYLPQINTEEGQMVTFPDKNDVRWREGSLTAIGKNTRVQPAATASLSPLGALQEQVRAKRFPIYNDESTDDYKWYAYQINGHDVWIAETTGLIWNEDAPVDQLYDVELGHMRLRLTAQEIDNYATTFESLAMIFRESGPP